MTKKIVGALEAAEQELGVRIPEDVWVEVLIYSQQKLEYIKSKDLFMKDCWKNEFNGIWDFLNRKRAALAK